jgi:putative MATE family efflux protein
MGRGEPLLETDPTQGSILKNILKMTFPLWFNSAYLILALSLEIYWVSRLGLEAVAALVVGQAAFMLLMTPIQGMVSANYRMIGNLVGRGDSAGLEKLVKEMLILGFMISLVLVLVGFFFAPLLLKFLGADPGVLSLAETYLRICVLGGVITFSFWIIDAILKSARGIVPASVIIGLINTIHIIFAYLLIFGIFGFPQLGLTGAALARVGSVAAGTLMGFWALTRGKSFVKLSLKGWKGFRINSSTIKEIRKLALPDTSEGILRTTANMAMLAVVAPWGTSVLAVYGIGERLLRMCSILGFDLGKTTAITVSQNLGAGNIQRAGKSSWTAVSFNAALLGSAGLVFFVFAPQIIGIFTQLPEAVEIGINYLRITIFGYSFWGAGIILRRAFLGAKDTRTPLAAYILLAVTQIGLALALPQFFSLGTTGIWLAILTAMIVYGSLLAILFKIGRWKQKFSCR